MVADHSFVDAKNYLAGERDNSVKHEYIDGHVYAMAGASDAHVTITLNLGALLLIVLSSKILRRLSLKVTLNGQVLQFIFE